MVVCSKQGAFTLACDTEKAMKDWLLVLNRVAVKVGGTSSPDMWPHVTVDDSPASTPEPTRRTCSDLSPALSRSCQDVSQGKLRTTATTTATGLNEN